jgi:hypothetical protein
MLTTAQHVLLSRLEVSFTIKIAELKLENSRLICEVNKWGGTSAAVSKLKQDAEEASRQLMAMLQIADLENQHPKKDIQLLEILDYRHYTRNFATN